jgi:hypothetical protein
MTVIDGAVAVLFHTPLLLLPDSITLFPAQNVVAPLAKMVDTIGCSPILTLTLCNDIAPARESALPKRDEPSNKLIAPLAITVPLKTELSLKLNCPFICQ